MIDTFILEEDVVFFNYHLEKNNILHSRSQYATDSMVLLRIPYPWDSAWADSVETILKSNPKQVIVFVVELHHSSAHWITQHPTLEYYINGMIYGQPTIQQHFFMDWFSRPRDFYSRRENILNGIHNNDIPDCFTVNALLGRRKPHRDLVYNGLKDNPNVTMTYMNTHYNVTDSVQDPTQFIWEGVPQSVNYTIDQIEYDGEQISLSHVIPATVYKNTYWCLVAETNHQTGYVFLTEKIVKPILAKKPFIIAGNPKSLEMLRILGFKTFAHLIDESYDLEVDLTSRINKVIDVTNNLTLLNSNKVRAMHEQIQEIVEHNYRVMMETDWQNINLSQCIISS